MLKTVIIIAVIGVLFFMAIRSYVRMFRDGECSCCDHSGDCGHKGHKEKDKK